MRDARKEPAARPQAGINVTPLVDVCLVLLIIFMVVVPMLQTVRLPLTADPERLGGEKEKRIVISMRQDGSTWYGERPLPDQELTARLRELRRGNAGAEVVLMADARLSFADVRRTMRRVNEAGFPGVGLAAKRQTD